MDTNHNGIDDDVEAAEYKSHSASAKFKQMLFYGIGAAMVFGLFSAVAQSIIHMMPAMGELSFSLPTLLPLAGLAGLAVLGVGALYLSAKYLSEGSLLDQKMQAKQISVANGKTTEVEPTVEQQKPAQQFPLALPSKAENVEAELPETAAPKTNWTEKFTPQASKPLLQATNDNEKSWGDKVKSAEPGADKQLAAL